MEIVETFADRCRVATAHDAVCKDECCYTFHSPFTTGILVNLETFAGTIQDLALLYSTTGIFLKIRKERLEKIVEETTTSAPPTKLAIGVEGGFATEEDKYEIISTYTVVVLEKDDTAAPKLLIELPYNDETKASFPETVQKSVDSIIYHVGISTQQEVQAWQNDEDIPVSKYAKDLPFVDNGILIDPNPSAWKCQKSGDTQNLWLNLSDGFIGGGRKNWDGSGGSNGALDHYEETGKLYPLVVKLGTITADLDTADCYSYASDEDGPVKIPNLAQLLEKRGIKVGNMQKTVKSTAELEVELNANYAFDAITEAGEDLQIVSGPGYQGLQNLGNSCYMNSIFQFFFSIPELATRYGFNNSVTEHPFVRAVAPTVAPTDVLCQTSKLACALTSGEYAKPPDVFADSNDPKYRLAPRMMKHCIGKDHVDFRTHQQQDAAQFLQYFLERLDRAELGATSTMVKERLSKYTASHLFSFQTTSRLVCGADGTIKYTESAPETIWSLRVPMDKAVVLDKPEQKRLKSEENAKPVPTVALQTCIDEWGSETNVDDLRWPHLGNAIHSAKQTLRFTNFPRYIIVQTQRYQLGADWTPIKLEVNIDVPQELDLSSFKSLGPADGETLVPNEGEVAAAPAPSAAVIDEAALAQLMDMGFSLNSCKRALNAVGGNDVEAAMGWVFEHNMDPDFNDPPEDPPAGAKSGDSGVDDGVVQSLVSSLGAFTADQVRAALKTTHGEAERAADWLFSHMDDLDGAIAALESSAAAPASKGPAVPLEDGSGNYSLIGMVSHIGKNTGSGHYVAHLKKDGKWVIFNDEKVALSNKPPFQHAYMYLYQRSDTIGAPNPNY